MEQTFTTKYVVVKLWRPRMKAHWRLTIYDVVPPNGALSYREEFIYPEPYKVSRREIRSAIRLFLRYGTEDGSTPPFRVNWEGTPWAMPENAQ